MKRGHDRGGAPPTGEDPHRGEDPAEDPPPEGRATQGTHTEHTQTTTEGRVGVGAELALRVLDLGDLVLNLRVAKRSP